MSGRLGSARRRGSRVRSSWTRAERDAGADDSRAFSPEAILVSSERGLRALFGGTAVTTAVDPARQNEWKRPARDVWDDSVPHPACCARPVQDLRLLRAVLSRATWKPHHRRPDLPRAALTISERPRFAGFD